MIKLSMPYDIEVKSLSKELNSLGFNPEMFVRSDKLSDLNFLLVLREGSLDFIKGNADVIKNDEQFQVICVNNDVKDITDEIDCSNVIISMLPSFQWGVGDNYDEFTSKKGDSYIHVTTNSDFSEMNMLWMCVELSYRYGVKFYLFNNTEEKDFYCRLERGSKANKSIMEDISKNKKKIEETYSCKLVITKSYNPKKREDNFEF